MKITMETNYATAARKTRECQTLEQLKWREERNLNCFNNGLFTIKEYERLCGIEMDVFAKLNDK